MDQRLVDLVTETALTFSERPVPTAVEILTALNRIAEKADAIGYARGVVAGSKHTAMAMDRVLQAMG